MYMGGLNQYPLLTACDREGKRFLKYPYVMKEDREHWEMVLPLASHIFCTVPTVLLPPPYSLMREQKQKFDLPTQILFPL